MKINTYPNPWDLRYFQEIAYTQNLSRAAERLGIGQPALSLSLKRLEESIQAKLFYRRHKGLTLTSAGQRLLKESNRLLADWEALIAQTKKSQNEMVGRFSLGAHPSVALYAINKALKKIYSEHQGIEIQLEHDLSRVISERVISGEIDFGIVVNPTRHPDLVIQKLATDEVGFWKVSGGLKDVLLCNSHLHQTQSLLKKIKSKKVFSRTITSDSLEVVASLAQAGLGTAILPTRVARFFNKDLELVEGLPVYQDEICFIYRSDLVKTSSSRYLIDTFTNYKLL
ncbi:LysR family transcriptional regulator [Pseudobdellovibrio exovorus]|uniref:LysR family transcriptional regulator n=1 Tax=Pseudobdellovibrio exovorus JSS TaxID=1184267 RepID=M4VD36_9BACT|nr:LysR family transcriptional regulator [Pseudobdellovibrio exovorus]AGH95946.1 LysR family transcriptional regulator [Pseudobdellovibrio exovorus JSS]